MSIFTEESIKTPELGYIISIPCQFVKGNAENTHPAIIENIARKLKQEQKNYYPVIVLSTGEETYQAVRNVQILEAAKKANLDFIWCMVVDEEMNRQVTMEAGEINKDVIQVPVLSASEEEIKNALSYIKQEKLFDRISSIKPKEAAKAIVQKRNENKISTSQQLQACLKKARCGIADKTFKKIENIFFLQ
jgi:hypothetical protein